MNEGSSKDVSCVAFVKGALNLWQITFLYNCLCTEEYISQLLGANLSARVAHSRKQLAVRATSLARPGQESLFSAQRVVTMDVVINKDGRLSTA